MFGIAFFGSDGSEQSNGHAAFGNAATGACRERVHSGAILRPSERWLVRSSRSSRPARPPLLSSPITETRRMPALPEPTENARWNGILAYYTQDFNDQTQPNAFSMRVRERSSRMLAVFVPVSEAITSTAAQMFALFRSGRWLCAWSGGGFLILNGRGKCQTLWEGTVTLQWKPAPSLMTRAEFRYDKSNGNVFLRGAKAMNNQQTLGFSVVYLF